jgi:hypothetical protein
MLAIISIIANCEKTIISWITLNNNAWLLWHMWGESGKRDQQSNEQMVSKHEMCKKSSLKNVFRKINILVQWFILDSIFVGFTFSLFILPFKKKSKNVKWWKHHLHIYIFKTMCVLMFNLGFHDAHNYIENITKLYFWTFFPKLLSKINQCTKMLILRTIFLKSS